MPLKQHLKSIANYNVRTLEQSLLAEISGCLGDLGTLLPLMIAMTLTGSIDLPSTLVFSGLTNIFTGVFFGIPLPVQPMKAIASVAISQNFSKEETAAAGLTMGIAVFLLSSTGLLRLLNKMVPVAVVKGIQVGAGLTLIINAGSAMIVPLQWTTPAYDNRIWSIAAFLLLIVAALIPRLPYALVVFTLGLIVGVVAIPSSSNVDQQSPLWHPSLVIPNGAAWRTGAIDAAIPQLPLTTLNSILAVTSLSATLFPSFPPTPSTTAIGFSVALSNLIGCWFGAMPICHGSGGLAGQYRFGARSGTSIVVLGSVKLVLGLFVGHRLLPLLQQFPKSLLGVMVLAAGVELAKVGQNVGESHEIWERANSEESRVANTVREEVERHKSNSWVVMLITVAGCLAFKNDAIGFLAGLLWHFGLTLPDWIDRLRHGRSIRLQSNNRRDSSDGLLGLTNHDR